MHEPLTGPSPFPMAPRLRLPGLDQPFLSGSVRTAVGAVPRVLSRLAPRDRLGTIKVRLAIGRHSYTVEPGLYALENPGPDSPVLVSANYKMSFDKLRRALPGRNCWVLVLDTHGVNVWCAAGKGTFGTDELVRRIQESGLPEVVGHRSLIVPQLGAPGVSAHAVKKLSGFKVVYGPILASDLPEFLDSGLKAKPRMRNRAFPIAERLALTPVEIIGALKTLLPVIPVVFFLSGFGGGGGFFTNATRFGLLSTAGLLAGVLAGGLLAPLLLPWLPGRAFAAKGVLPGLAAALLFVTLRNGVASVPPAGALETAAWFLLIPAISAYMAMNFTGSSTFTSLSGVKKEMRWAVPLEIAAAAAGTVFWVLSRFI